MSTPAPISLGATARKKVTTLTLRQKKERGEIITMLTAYDYPTAMAMDKAGVDAILVGDSLAMVVLGYENTLPVTMEEMLHHSRAVARGAKTALLVGDMPFMSYQVSVEEATRNAGRFLQQGVGRHEKTGGAETALQGMVLLKRLLQWMQRVALRQPFNSHQLGPIGLHREHETGTHRRAVIQDRTGAADAVFAPQMCAGQVQLFAQEIGQCHAHRRCAFVDSAVDGQVNMTCCLHAICPQ